MHLKEERQIVLNMLSKGDITVNDADMLLLAIENSQSPIEEHVIYVQIEEPIN